MSRSGLPFVLCLALAAAGCSSRPDRLLTVGPADVEGAGRVEMLVATTRTAADDPGILFTGERAREISLADVAISIPPAAAREVGAVQWPRRVPGDAAREFVTVRADVVDADGGRKALRRMLARQPDGHVLVFVHGYNNRFEDAVFNFAQFAHDSDAPAVPVLFTWPSRGQLLAYGYDRESANYSRDALETFLGTLSTEPGVREITVLAHSMGNWVTLEALRQMAIRSGGRLPRKLRSVLLAAPDVDVDVFRGQLREIGPAGPKLTLLVSGDDQALAVSRRLWGGSTRLGAVDPTEEPYRSDLAGAGVEVIDVTDEPGRGINHSKFAHAPEVVRMIGKRLAEGQALGTGRSSLGDRIGIAASSGAAAVGGAVGLAITAPLAIVDDHERRSFGERARTVAADTGAAISATYCPTGRTDAPVPPGCPQP